MIILNCYKSSPLLQKLLLANCIYVAGRRKQYEILIKSSSLRCSDNNLCLFFPALNSSFHTFQSTLDMQLAMVALASCYAICSLITSATSNRHK